MFSRLILAATLLTLAFGQSLPEAVTVDGIMEHLAEFQQIALIDDLNSRSVRDNYNESAAYVIETLRSIGCVPEVHDIIVPVHEHLSQAFLRQDWPENLAFQYSIDYAGMRYGGSGAHNITAKIARVANFGCDLSDFADVADGSIAVIQEGGSCDFVQKAYYAEDSGAAGILFASSATRFGLLNTRVRTVDYVPGDRLVVVPCLAVSYLVGQLFQNGDIIHLEANMLLTLDPTTNILCTTSGRDDTVVMIGAHLDSVPEGPGLNDNGSGSAMLLEIAVQFFKLGLKPENKVRFAWWGAEEIGLLGSRYYCRDEQERDPEDYRNIAMYMNFDMTAAPNYVPYIHDGYQVGSNIPEHIKVSSRIIQEKLEEYFEDNDWAYTTNSMVGGSDFLPFLESDVPTSGCATGASGIKTMDERIEFGGFANAPYDPCYHLSCDTLENINQVVLGQIAGASSNALEFFAMQKDLRGYLQNPRK